MIEVCSLEKRYGPIQALRGISASFRRGVVSAIAGPNGSGKSTFIKILLGLVRPEAGGVFFDGDRLNGHHEYRRFIGYMPQEGQFPENLRVSEVIQLVQRVRGGMSVLDDSLIRRFQLGGELRKRIRTLSGGTRQKVNAAIALMVPSKLLILDEPTAGLDPVCSGILKREILERKQRGSTVILTTHISSDIDELADDVAFLCDGRLLYQGSIDQLRHLTGADRMEAAFANLMNGDSA